MLNILIDLPPYQPAIYALKRLPGVALKQVEKPEERSRPLPTELIYECDILLCTVPPANHLEMQQLKLIQIASAGYKQVTEQGFEERQVRVCNALGVFDVPIAEWNIAMMINLARDLRGMVRNQENATWDRSARFQHEIRGLVVGIWGYGGIGRETARLAKALGMRVHVMTRSGVHPRAYTYAVPGTGDTEGLLPDQIFLPEQKKEFLSGLDFLIMAIPHTSHTEGIIGAQELDMLKPGALLLNPARGPLINEVALINALANGSLAGAALDTHYHYPMPPDHPLWGMPNVIMTPHISGSSSSPHFLERVYDIFLQNLQRFQTKQTLLNELSAAQLQGA